MHHGVRDATANGRAKTAPMAPVAVPVIPNGARGRAGTAGRSAHPEARSGQQVDRVDVRSGILRDAGR